MPEQILWRTKEAFSDGVSSQKESAFTILQKHIDSISLEKNQLLSQYTKDKMKQKYYRDIFEKYYPEQGHIIPYFWMPRFVEASDS